MKPGAIVNISRNHSETSNTLPNDWYREEKWKRIYDWMSEIQKETQKSGNEVALLQTKRLQTVLNHLKNKETYKEQQMPAYFIADLERFNRSWDRISPQKSDSRPKDLSQENSELRRELEKLEEMRKKIKYSN